MDQQEILQRLLSTYKTADTKQVSTIEGSFVFDTLSANAVEFTKAYAEIDLVKDIAFVQNSWGIYLTQKAEEYGIIRKSATHAVVMLTIQGTASSVIPAHSLFTTVDGKCFYTLTEAVINSDSIKVKAQAKDTGPTYNVAKETITQIPMTIYGVSSVTNEAAAYDGFDEETDEELKARVLFKMRMPATSGNVYHYEKWAMSVEGVGGVKVLPLWNGPGTVKVVIINTEHTTASEDLIEKVKSYLLEEAPIGATVTVVSASTKPIDISLTVTKGKGNVDGIKQILAAYFKEHALLATEISYAQVGRILLDNERVTGVQDYRNLQLNTGTSNIAIEPHEIASVGEVTIHA